MEATGINPPTTDVFLTGRRGEGGEESKGGEGGSGEGGEGRGEAPGPVHLLPGWYFSEGILADVQGADISCYSSIPHLIRYTSNLFVAATKNQKSNFFGQAKSRKRPGRLIAKTKRMAKSKKKIMEYVPSEVLSASSLAGRGFTSHIGQFRRQWDCERVGEARNQVIANNLNPFKVPITPKCFFR